MVFLRPWNSADGDVLAHRRNHALPEFSVFAIVGDGRLVGDIAVATSGPYVDEMSLWLTPAARGRGYATEAVRRLLAMRNGRALTLQIDPRNTDAAALMRRLKARRRRRGEWEYWTLGT